MDSQTGNLYPSEKAAREAGVLTEHIVTLEGPPEAVRAISGAVKAQRRKKNKVAKASRKRNR